MINEPLLFESVLFERVWGGNRLGRLFGKPLPAGKVIGESWELCDRPEAQTRVAAGPLAGKTLRELLEAEPDAILGHALAERHPQRFPLLLKYVDAGAPLSVQVHPDDAGAKAFNDRGKTECWVIVHVDPGASIVRGFKEGVTKEQYALAVAEDRVEELLHAFTPKVGDCVALTPGLVHAIGKGVVVAEIQQNSDVTLRIYDYKRLGLDGKPRPLHVKEAESAIRFDERGNEFDGDLSRDTMSPVEEHAEATHRYELLLRGLFFNLERYTVRASKALMLPASNGCRVAMALEGSGRIGKTDMQAGQTLLLPAALPTSPLVAGPEGLTIVFSAPTPASC
jgi:mannose-6-phosphate isomerase